MTVLSIALGAGQRSLSARIRADHTAPSPARTWSPLPLSTVALHAASRLRTVGWSRSRNHATLISCVLSIAPVDGATGATALSRVEGALGQWSSS